jgi:hypothetical protein
MSAGMIGERQLSSRRYWIGEISKLSGDFNADSAKVQEELTQELVNDGADALIGHLRLCGAIPEQYDHDSSEEKLYSKYTDVVISKAFQAIGLTSWVLSERSDAADVECVAEHYSFVADAKAFRHQQATSRSVCLFSYTHLAVLARYAGVDSQERAVELLHEVFRTVDAMNPSKDATGYWQALNRRIIDFDAKLSQIWSEEKIASSESVRLAKEEALRYFASERERIMRLSKEEAIEEVLRASKIENKVMAAKSVTDNTLLAVE